jgi:radical SAM protein with 4Fe4S-binding SPASM domain
MVEIFNVDYNEYVDIVGTAHFTRRSINDAYESITTRKPKDVALELDWKRFQLLNTACLTCPKRGLCKGICEFTGAAEALGNIDANMWLIDMTEHEIRTRIKSQMTPFERTHKVFQIYGNIDEDPIRLWEKGFKDRVINNSKRRIEALRKFFPSVWRVLIDERNALMAARLAWITSKNLNEEKDSKILAFVGAAHVEEIKHLLMKPILTVQKLREFNLSFTEPILVRRVAVQEAAPRIAPS